MAPPLRPRPRFLGRGLRVQLSAFLCLGVVMVALEGHVPVSTTAARNWRLLRSFLKYRLQVLFLANTALIIEMGGYGGHCRFP